VPGTIKYLEDGQLWTKKLPSEKQLPQTENNDLQFYYGALIQLLLFESQCTVWGTHYIETTSTNVRYEYIKEAPKPTVKTGNTGVYSSISKNG
jgi:hypothetical protein